eukprot:1148392-Pelagomonas_calceolata.AAC.7
MGETRNLCMENPRYNTEAGQQDSLLTKQSFFLPNPGETRNLRLDNPKDNMEAGQRDSFLIRAEDVGPLQRVKVKNYYYYLGGDAFDISLAQDLVGCLM